MPGIAGRLNDAQVAAFARDARTANSAKAIAAKVMADATTDGEIQAERIRCDKIS